jgi:hypothetical protein
MLIYLKGVKMAQLTPILRFVYLGETEVSQGDLNQFMNAAKGLEIRRLMAVSQRNELKEGTKDVSSNELFKQDPNSSEIHGKSVKRDQFTCDQCDYKASRADHLRRHMFTVHENGRIQCNRCEFSATRADNLKRRIRRIHTRSNESK